MTFYTSPPFYTPMYHTEVVTKYKPKYLDGVRVRRFSVDKMLRQLARNTPDAVWLTIDVSQDDSGLIYEKWRDHWVRMMQIKYPRQRRTINLYEAKLFDPPHHVRLQLVSTEEKHG